MISYFASFSFKYRGSTVVVPFLLQIQETEKQLKAKQFQHLSIHTTVTPFSPPGSDGESVDNQRQDGEENDKPDLENTQIRSNGSLELSDNENDQVAS